MKLITYINAAGLFLLLSAFTIRAQTNGSWIVDANGDWSQGTNWSGGSVPGGAESIVNFTNNITAHRAITIDDTSRTVGVLNVGDSDGSHAFTFGSSGAALLIFDNGSSAAEINLSGGANTFGESPQTLSFQLNSSLTINNSSSSTQWFLRQASSQLSAGTSGTKILKNEGTGTGEVRLGANISNGSGVIAIEQNSATSMLTLTLNTGTYTGGVTVNAGRLRLGSSQALGATNGILTLNGGGLSTFGGTARSFNNAAIIGGDVVLGNATDNGEINFNGGVTLTTNSVLTIASNIKMSKAMTGGYGITKAGAATLTLIGSHTYSGDTTVSAGTLLLGVDGSIKNSPVVSIANGATLDATTPGFEIQDGQTLKNAGTFTGSLTALSGSTYAPGNSAGTATQNGDLALNLGSTFDWELIANTASGAGSNFDQTVFLSGGLTIQSSVTANLIFNEGSSVDWSDSFWGSDQEWLLFSGADSLTANAGIFSTINVGVDSLSATLGSVRPDASFSFYNSGNDIYLQYTAVPEPSTMTTILLVLGVGCLLRRRRSAA